MVLVAGITLLSPVSPLSASLPQAAADEWREGQYWLDEYGFRQAWERTRGEGVTVAVIDTGIDAAHPDLTGQVAGGIDVSGAGSPDGNRPVGPRPQARDLVASVLAGHGHHAKASPPASSAASDARRPVGVHRDGHPAPEPSPPSPPSAASAAQPGARRRHRRGPEVTLRSVSVHRPMTTTGGPTQEEQIARASHLGVDHGADVITVPGSTRQGLAGELGPGLPARGGEQRVIVPRGATAPPGHDGWRRPATIPGVLTVARVLNDDGARPAG